MANKVYWFNLPQVLKAAIETRKGGALPCLDIPTVDAAIEALTWHRLPEKVAALVAVTNGVLTATTFTEEVTWFNLASVIGRYLDRLDESAC